MKDLPDMTREELRDYMKSNGEIHRPNKDTYSWKYAFKLAVPVFGKDLDMSCGKCWDKVKEWLLR